MTFGQKMILQQIQLVAHARGWDIPKSIKKVTEVLGCLQKIHDQAQQAKANKATPIEKTGRAISSPEEARLIAQAEQILKDLEDKAKPNPPDLIPPPPQTPPI